MRGLTTAQRNLLRRGEIKGNLLVSFYLDEGTYRFCDDHVDLGDGLRTYIGASALGDAAEVKSGADLAAEPITLVCDGNRMADSGIHDPARVLRDILGYLHQQRRVDYALGLRDVNVQQISMVIPLHAGKINNVRLIDPAIDIEATEPTFGRLEITIDALASRYNRATFRTRSHADQLEIDATDNFFSYVADAVAAERTLYWGKKDPGGSSAAGTAAMTGNIINGQQNFATNLGGN